MMKIHDSTFMSKLRRIFFVICPIWFFPVLVFSSFSETAFSAKLCSSIATKPKELTYEEKNNWESTSQGSLNGHIVSVHLRAGTLYSFGIPRWDFEIARIRGFNVNWVLQNIYKKLERSNADIRLEISSQVTYQERYLHALLISDFNPEVYRLYLVKTIHFMVDLGLLTFESIDWARANAAYPNADTVTYSLETDARVEGSFFTNHGLDPKTYYKVFRP